MLSETQIKNLKPMDKAYKVTDRDGLYLVVTPSNTKSFRYNYKINGRNETLTIGRWKEQVTLAEARERLAEAKKLIAQGVSPSRDKKRAKAISRSGGTVAEWLNRFLEWKEYAPSTLAGRRYIAERFILPRFGSQKLSDLTFQDIRDYVDEIAESGAPSSAVFVRDLLCFVYDFAIARDSSIEVNPARRIKSATVYRQRVRDRALSEIEIANFYAMLKEILAVPQNKLGAKLLLLTMCRKSELAYSKWDEIDFEKRTWTIPKERMKMGRPHIVYLSRQALEIFEALRILSNGSDSVFPAMKGKQLSNTLFNRIINRCVEKAKEKGLLLNPFGPHDLRRTASTLLHEAGFNSDVIEKCLAHEQGGVRAVYNKAEYAEQRRELLQAWADMIDSYSEKPKN